MIDEKRLADESIILDDISIKVQDSPFKKKKKKKAFRRSHSHDDLLIYKPDEEDNIE